MTAEVRQREAVCRLARSLFVRGLTNGSSGNISVRCGEGYLVTPTGQSFGDLDPARLSVLGPDLTHVAGDAPTKELPLHAAFYQTRGPDTGAVVHLHSTHSVAVSMLPGLDPDCVFAPLTAYSVMRLGRVKLLPFFRPGDPAMGAAVRGLAGRRSAVLLANHGPVVAARDLEAAVYAAEELEEVAKLTLLTLGLDPRPLSATDVADLRRHFAIDWDG
ncbi:MAG: aldolase [Alphaproteobacteria bacterium HGW-Alphaproteobacteria-2]|nr:MAG: aldolase [Alphaproteobacteria bacterium HGW-Alphaproteobacteria-2]